MGNDNHLPSEAADFTATLVSLETTTLDAPPADDAFLSDALGAAEVAAIEEGIASVFDTIRSEGWNDAADNGAAEVDAEPAEPTFALLDELNRIWAQAA